jgi:internalin A
MRTSFLRRAGGSAASLLLVFYLGACSSSTEPGADDGTAPAPINDLSVTEFTATSVTLTWTATGDDEEEGTAARYEIRVSDQFIFPGNWEEADLVPDPPVPQPAGTTEFFTISGLSTETRYFFALTAFDEAGNSFGCSNCVDATCFVDEEITIADPNLEAVIRGQLVIPTGPLYSSDLRGLDDLDAEGHDITSLVGLEECVNLVFLRLHDNQISDLTPLTGLTQLFDLSLAYNQITDLGPLAGLSGLEHLWADDNQITDLSPLAGVTTLTWLRLERNTITDLTALANLTALEWLALGGNTVVSVDPLAGLTELTQLSLTGNAITDASSLAGLTALESLQIGSNQISGLGFITDMTQLTHLFVYANQITDLTPATGLTQLVLLQASRNQVTDLSPLLANAGLGAGDTVNLEFNPLSADALNLQIPALEARGVLVEY